MILLIDNYDSFTFNLVHFLGDVGARCEVVRNDKLTVAEALARSPEAIVLSPGPCTPNEAGICLDLIAAAAGKVPILGVCLGHQAIGQAFGGEVIRAPVPMHGKLSAISHDGTGILEGVPNPFSATRYHSLIVARDSLPETLIPPVSQGTLADMIGTTRSRVSFFMNRFRKLGYIKYNGGIRVHKSLLKVFLQDQLPEENSSRPKLLDHPPPSRARTAKRAKLV